MDSVVYDAISSFQASNMGYTPGIRVTPLDSNATVAGTLSNNTFNILSTSYIDTGYPIESFDDATTGNIPRWTLAAGTGSVTAYTTWKTLGTQSILCSIGNTSSISINRSVPLDGSTQILFDYKSVYVGFDPVTLYVYIDSVQKFTMGLGATGNIYTDVSIPISGYTGNHDVKFTLSKPGASDSGIIALDNVRFNPVNSNSAYILKPANRVNLDRLMVPKAYIPNLTKGQVDILGAVTRSNTAQAGSSNTITLDTSASAVDGIYTGSMIILTSRIGVSQSRMLTGYVGATKVATVSPAWSVNPAINTGFSIYPVIASNVTTGYDFTQIDYSATPTINIMASLEKYSGASASPVIGIPLVLSTEVGDFWKTQPPAFSSNATTTYSTALSITGRARLDLISSFCGATGGIPWVRITIDGVVWATDLVVGATTATSGFDFPFNLQCNSSMLIEHKSAGAFLSNLAISYSK